MGQSVAAAKKMITRPHFGKGIYSQMIFINFDPIKIDYKFLDRENDLHEIPVKEDITIPVDVLLDTAVGNDHLVSVN